MKEETLRFRAVCIKEEDKWGYEVYISELGQDKGIAFSTKCIFDTKEKAIENAKKSIHEITEDYAKGKRGTISEVYNLKQ